MIEQNSSNRYFHKKVPGDKFTPCALAIKLEARCLLESSVPVRRSFPLLYPAGR